jgi:hypothetical protein
MHIDRECRCTCTIAELDNGTDGPTRTGSLSSGSGAFRYVGKYSGPYIGTLDKSEKITYGGGG